MRLLFCTLALIIMGCNAFAQDSSKVIISGYVEAYYQYDFDKPKNHLRPSFIYNHKKHNEVNINLAFVKAAYTTSKVRANVALMSGTYPQFNLAAEPTIFQYVYEANLGIKLSKKSNTWLDVGVMPSHIGFESAVSADCYTPSRSLLAENSPYFETGVKLTHTNKKENLTVALLYLNGWQRIQKPDDFNTPSFGMQFNYKPSSNLTLNYSNFFGTDKPDSVKAFRTYHNFYAIYEPSKKFGLIAGFDIGTEKKATWYSPVIIAKTKLSKTATMAARAEWFNDKNQILQSTGTANGFNVMGLSANVDFAVTPNVLCRIEAKNYSAKDAIFKSNTTNNNFSLLGSVSVKF